ncbi:MAG: hypothetical protein Q8S26_14655 [Azonexus sp.]|nr:hypothetical protein [Azonexus sp.]
MPSKKPPLAPSTAAKTSTQPPSRKNTQSTVPGARQQPDNRWQRSKHYGWDSR